MRKHQRVLFWPWSRLADLNLVTGSDYLVGFALTFAGNFHCEHIWFELA